MRTWRWLGVLALAVVGCQPVPHGFERVKPVVRPMGRTLAILPFSPGKDGNATVVDGIKLAEYAAIELQVALLREKTKVLGPSAMREALKEGVNEARWTDIGRQAGAKLLVVGEVTYLDMHFDKLIQAREGVIGVEFRVLDVTTRPAKSLARVNWRLMFPEGAGEKFESRYAEMKPEIFRNEMVKFAATRVARIFFEYRQRRGPSSQLEATWRVE